MRRLVRIKLKPRKFPGFLLMVLFDAGSLFHFVMLSPFPSPMIHSHAGMHAL
jgi:hypothetical protein